MGYRINIIVEDVNEIFYSHNGGRIARYTLQESLTRLQKKWNDISLLPKLLFDDIKSEIDLEKLKDNKPYIADNENLYINIRKKTVKIGEGGKPISFIKYIKIKFEDLLEDDDGKEPKYIKQYLNPKYVKKNESYYTESVSKKFIIKKLL